MASASEPFFSLRRIGVTGGVSAMGDVEIAFCRAVAETLVNCNAVLVTRGGKGSAVGQPERERRVVVDDVVVEAACRVLKAAGKSFEAAIQTVLSEDGAKGREQFQIGTITRVRGRTLEAERFGFVNRLDAAVGIGGGRGTEQTLTLALATERPILPVAAFGGASAGVWEEHEPDLARNLSLDEAAKRRWTNAPVDANAAAELGKEMIERFLGAMARQCFVIMPFHESHSALYDFVIEPAVVGLGDSPIRLDRVGKPGDVGQQIRAAIQRADYVVVVLDGLRPNVLYELGLAHGRDKPTILLSRRGSLESDVVPFDLTMQQRLEYDEITRELPERLRESIRALGRRS
jgi:hypothetical protein